MCYRQSRRGVSRQNSEKCKTIVCIANTFTHRRFYTDSFYTQSFYTQKLLHTEAFTHRSFYTQKLLHTEAFTHRSFYTQDASTQKLLHTDAFTHRHFYTQTLLHTGAAFTHKRLYTQKLLHTDAFTHRHFYTQTLLHTDTFTHRRFYTQTLLHTEALLHTNTFTHRRFYIQRLLRRNTFTHRRFYTQTVLHTSAFTHNHLYTQTLLHRGRPMYSQRSHRCRGHLSNPTGWCGEVLFPCDSKPASINMSWGLCALGPPNQGGLPSPWKKYKRADLAGGDRFWAGTHTVLQYDISWFFLGLGSWLLTVTGMETLILTLIHPSLNINSHTSIFISYLLALSQYKIYRFVSLW